MTEWFYRMDGTNEGPVSEDDLKHIFDSKALPLSTSVWKEGMEDWVEAQTIPVLAGSSPAIPSVKPNVQPAPDLPAKTETYGITKPAKWAMGGLAGACLVLLVAYGTRVNQIPRCFRWN